MFGKLFFSSETPVPYQAKLQPLDFPDAVPLDSFTLLGGSAIAGDKTPVVGSQKRLINGHVYKYEKDGRSLTIQMYYMFDTSGNVIGFLDSHTDIPEAAIGPSLRIERYRQAVGYYLLFPYQGRDYLASCINPRGETTVTLPQFRDNRYRYDIWSPRLLRWLFTAENIRDFRCLWVLISAVAEKPHSASSYAGLEQIWFDWQAQWQARFSHL
ncbi:MAG: cyanoexosortase A system-associated protein [Leptolyngbyaceae cyanobacterium SM1_1_3]|nr:cyanoexosortase A system-associated protein [Leptolyngbyaceae cyanobacterium SM1_1_3]NJN03099.1 cyanoexosortase A system-associated protein [Leptolyngbyaceae cyanobacterium RM1_1_2]NJO09599.1 cyanoexosortase A system-associated protein [Leptolyngbyaceae cyanobacterium SL_1_1]